MRKAKNEWTKTERLAGLVVCGVIGPHTFVSTQWLLASPCASATPRRGVRAFTSYELLVVELPSRAFKGAVETLASIPQEATLYISTYMVHTLLHLSVRTRALRFAQ